MKYLGFQKNVYPWIDQSNVMVRMTKHDGLARLIVECFSRGRHVIFSRDFPGAIKAANYAEVCQSIKKLMVNPTINDKGIAVLKEKFDYYKWDQNLQKYYENLLAK